MIVTIVTPWYPSETNPVSGIFVSREVRALLASGLEVRVVHLDRDVPDGRTTLDSSLGHRVLHIGMRPANPISVVRAVPKLRHALRGADVVNSHAISSLPVVAAAAGGRPWVHTEHWSALSNPESASPLLRAVRPAFGRLLRLPDVVVAESERLAEPIRCFRGVGSVEIIPCIVPAPSVVVERAPSRGVVRLASTGGVIDRKDPLLAVKVLSELERRGVRASLRWVGEGDLREEADRLGRELGVDASFLGQRSPAQVEEELAAADVFLAPTKGENFFVAAAEALVNGRPLVASEKGGHTEYASPDFTEIVGERTPGAYADAVISVLEKSAEVAAQEISASVRDLFSPETVADSYTALYRRVQQDGTERRWFERNRFDNP